MDSPTRDDDPTLSPMKIHRHQIQNAISDLLVCGKKRCGAISQSKPCHLKLRARPPTRSLASRTSTSKSFSRNKNAALSPDIPAPRITIFSILKLRPAVKSLSIVYTPSGETGGSAEDYLSTYKSRSGRTRRQPRQDASAARPGRLTLEPT